MDGKRGVVYSLIGRDGAEENCVFPKRVFTCLPEPANPDMERREGTMLELEPG